MFINFETKNNSYKCKLSTRALIDIEDKLGDNPINIISSVSEDKLPKLSTLLTILYYSLRDMTHGVRYEDVYAIYDDYLEGGGDLMTFMEFIMQLFQESGIIGKNDEEETKTEEQSEKN